eukprot:14494836-Alexandrium_andersonii.AAC.1
MHIVRTTTHAMTTKPAGTTTHTHTRHTRITTINTNTHTGINAEHAQAHAHKHAANPSRPFGVRKIALKGAERSALGCGHAHTQLRLHV